MINYKQSGEQIALDLLNQANGTEFTLNDVKFTNIQAIEGEYNTTATVVPTLVSDLEDEVDIYYNRIDVSKLFNGVNLVLKPVQLNYVSDYLSLFNDTYGFWLGKEDIVEGILPNITKYPVRLPITIREGHPAYFGTFYITLTDIENSLKYKLDNIMLNAKLYPVDSDKIQGPIYCSGINFTDMRNHILPLVEGELIETNKLDWFNLYSEDLWVCLPVTQDFNFYNARVLYNREIGEDNPYTHNKQYSHVCVIELDNDYCEAITGYLVMHYNNPVY